MTEHFEVSESTREPEQAPSGRAVVIEGGHVFVGPQRPQGGLVQMVDSEGRLLFDSQGRRILCDVTQQKAPPYVTAANWLIFIGVMVAIIAITGVILGIITVVELHHIVDPPLNP